MDDEAGLFECPVECGAVGDVGELEAGAAGLDLGGQRRVDVEPDDLAALLGQPPGHRAADEASGSGDDRGLPFRLHPATYTRRALYRDASRSPQRTRLGTAVRFGAAVAIGASFAIPLVRKRLKIPAAVTTAR